MISLLQGHQPGDGTVQFLVQPPHAFDLVDGMEHRRVMHAAELAANLLQRGPCELPRHIHRKLAREGV